MYLRGSKWTMKRRRRSVNFWLVIFLLAAVGAFVYLDLFVVPTAQPLFIPTTTPTRDPRSYAQEAEARLNEGKISQAIDLYKQANEADPKNAANYLALARLQVYIGAYKDAQPNIENAILLNKNNAEALAMLGWDMGYLGDYLAAKASLDSALEMDPNNAIIYAYYAEMLALQINNNKGGLSTDKASEYSKKALALDNSLMEVHRARGMVLEVTQNLQEAAAEYSAAIKINGNIADLHLSYGRTLELMANYSKAVDEFSLAAALIPTDPLPNLYISRTYNKSGDIAKAIQYGEQALKYSPVDPDLYGNLGSMYYRNHEYDKAITNLRMAIRGGMATGGHAVQGIPLSYDTTVLIYYARYGLALARQNQCNEAVQISQALIQGVPNDEDTIYNAHAMVQICQENINGTATPSPSPKASATPKP
jgi:tetratricopeptide (TPR) repeat protein